MTIVLASQSASRKAMLADAGVDFVARPASLDERALEQQLGHAAAPEIALALARAKALAAADPLMHTLGSDSLVVVGGQRFDKPGTFEEAGQHLRFFSGKVMELHSAAAIALQDRIIWDHADVAQLHVRELSEDFIARYLEAEWPAVSGCVGVFRVEGLGVQLFDKIDGSHFTVLGMPLVPVLGALRNLGELAA